MRAKAREEAQKFVLLQDLAQLSLPAVARLAESGWHDLVLALRLALRFDRDARLQLAWDLAARDCAGGHHEVRVAQRVQLAHERERAAVLLHLVEVRHDLVLLRLLLALPAVRAGE